MSDTSTNKFIGYGTNAERLAFTPSPATIAAAPHQAYIWYATDTDNVYAYTTAWHQISSSSSGSAISALTGDVTATGPGSAAATIANNAVTTAKINNAAVTLAKIANAAANDKLLGSGNSGSGAAYAEITLGSGLTMTGTTLSAGAGTVTTTGSPASGNLTKFSGAASVTNADLTGDVTTSGTVATTIANSAVTLAKIANAAASSKLLGSGASGSGAPYAELTLGTNLSMSGTTLNASGGGGGGTTSNAVINGRLTTESGVPISTSDRTGQSTIYFTPYNGNQMGLYTGAAWVLGTFSQISLALSSLTSGKNYDVFVDYNGGTPQLVLSAAWASDTTRTDAIALQDGVYVKSGTTTYRLVGTIRTTGTTTTEDSITNRFVWNLYNRTPRALANATETTDSWSYSTATFRQANGNTANELRFVVGVSDMQFSARVYGLMSNSGVGNGMVVGVGVNSTSTNSALHHGAAIGNSLVLAQIVSYDGYPRLGYNFIPWLEYTNAGTGTFYGDANIPAVYQAGIAGVVWN